MTDLDRVARGLPQINADSERWCWSCGKWAKFTDDGTKCPSCELSPEPHAIPAECRVALDGEKLQDFRREQGWSQAQMAELWGVSRATVSNFETGTFQMHAWHLRLLSRMVEIEIEELLDRFDATHFRRGHAGPAPWEPVWADEEAEEPRHARNP